MSEQKLVVASKINVLACITLLIGIAGIWNILPEQLENQLYETTLIATPVMTIIFRTYFTNTRLTWKS